MNARFFPSPTILVLAILFCFNSPKTGVAQENSAWTIPKTASQQIDRASLEVLFQRFRDDPPPWKDRDRMEEWLARYGRISPSGNSDCDRIIMLEAPERMPGFETITSHLQGICEPAPSDGPPSSILMQAAEGDDAAEETVRQALQAVLGPHHQKCSNNDRTAWEVSNNVSIALISPLWPTFAVSILNVPVTDFDCR